MSNDQHQPTTEFQAPPAEEINSFLPNYQVDSLLATGGMGAVYQGTQISLDRPVAIKVLPRELSSTEEFRQSFEKEAKLMARLNHPNLISVYDFGNIDGMLYLTMEFVNGQTLFEAHNGQILETTDALELVSSICRGLENAHQAGILHRDIKPANILYNSQGQPKIGDFGLARPSTDIESGVIYGTPGYSAPEVIKDPSAVGPATDVFSVGVLLYELLTARLPEAPYVAIDHLSRPPVSVDAVIQQSIHPDPQQRFQSAGEFADAIDALLKALSDPNYAIAQKLNVPVPSAAIGQVQTSSTPTPTSKPITMQKNKSGLGPTKFVIILALLGGIYYALEYKEEKEKSIDTKEQAMDEKNDEIRQENKQTIPQMKDARAERLAELEASRNAAKRSKAAAKPSSFEPLPPLDIDIHPAYSKIREKAIEITGKENAAYYKKMQSISENFLWDLNILADRMNNKDKEDEKLNLEVIKESIHPKTFAILDVAADVSSNEGINELVTEVIAKQKKITAAYEDNVDSVRQHLIKHVTTIRVTLLEQNESQEASDATRILERAGESPRAFATMF